MYESIDMQNWYAWYEWHQYAICVIWIHYDFSSVTIESSGMEKSGTLWCKCKFHVLAWKPKIFFKILFSESCKICVFELIPAYFPFMEGQGQIASIAEANFTIWKGALLFLKTTLWRRRIIFRRDVTTTRLPLFLLMKKQEN